MAYSLPPRDAGLDAFNFVLDVFDSGDGGGAAAHCDPSKGGAGALTETISFDDLLAMPLPFDAGVYGAGQQSLLAAAHRSYGAASLPRPASWAGPLESLVIAQGTVVPRKQGRAPPRRAAARKLPSTREHGPSHAAADAEVAATNAAAANAEVAAARAMFSAPAACVPPRPSSAPPSLDAAPATAAEQTAAAEAGLAEVTLAEVATAGLAVPAPAKRAASQAFLSTLREHGGAGAPAAGGKKPRDRSGAAGPPRRSSVYRGVTRHRWTGRFEAHLWDAASERAPGSTRGRQKGKQVYLGGYCTEEQAARAYDVAAIKYWGDTAMLNFEFADYAGELEDIARLTTAELVAHLRRKSSGFSRGASKFRGVTRHHQHGRWEARIGRVMGNKYLYLGTFSSELEAARAYDRAAIRYRGARAVTNFNISEYAGEDLGAMGTDALEAGAAAGELAGSMLMGAQMEGSIGGAASISMFEDLFSGHAGGHAMPMDAQMAAAGAAQHSPQHGGMMHDDMVMMPGAMATHDFAAFANGGTGAWGFGL